MTHKANRIRAIKPMIRWKSKYKTNCFQCYIPKHDIFSEEWDVIIPFGDRCASALALTYVNYRKKSYPFDFVVIPPRTIYRIITMNDFDNFYPKNAKSYTNNKYNINFLHFKKNSHNYNYDIFQKRARRLMNIFKSSRKTLFLYTTESHVYSKKFRNEQDSNYNYLKKITTFLHTAYPSFKFKILVCNLNKERKDTADIVNINIRCDNKLISNNGEAHTFYVNNAYRIKIAEIINNLKLNSI